MPKALFLTLKTVVGGAGYPDLRGYDFTRNDANAVFDGYGWAVAQETQGTPPDTVLLWVRSTVAKLLGYDASLQALDARCGMIGEVEPDE